MGAARLAAMGAVAAALIGFFAYLMFQFSQPQLTVLFTDLEFDDSIAVVKKLEALNVPHEVRQDGAVILAPKDQVLRLRMSLAEDGLPSGGTVGYEIFDKTGTLGTTSFVQDINQLRALEGELARTIRALDRVERARVHLVLPKKKLFSRESAVPTASIVLKVRGQLERAQIRSIQHLAASAVEGLTPERVSIVDDKGNLLASGDDSGELATAARSDERTLDYERRLQGKIEEIVDSVVGNGRARVRVTADLDYNKIVKTSDSFDPDGRVVRSTQTREESRDSARTGSNDGVSVGNELPNANAAKGGTEGEKDASKKSEEIVNYEVSRTQQTETLEAGRIRRLSVAVLVDGNYTPGTDNKPVYAERPQEELDKIGELVKSAMGFDKDRGDKVNVINLRFADIGGGAETEEAPAGWFELGKDDYFHIAELAVLLIVSTLVLLLVVRPLIRRIVTPEVDEDPHTVLIGTYGAPRVTADGQLIAADGSPLALDVRENATMEAIKNAKIAGELHASAIQEVGNMVKDHPTDAVAIIRQWINDDDAKREQAA
jgi:flagellar M-ring protein FliF